MPCYKVVKSLEFFCVRSIAEDLGKGKWCEKFVEDEGDPGYWLSPFDVLPPGMLAAIFEAVKNTKGATRKEECLGLLITKKLDCLDLTSFPGLMESPAFHLISSAALQHSPLKTLKFCFKQISYRRLQDVLPAFPHLQVLDVSHSTTVNDSFLALVASCCTQLKSLVLDHCDHVTDVGMKKFCLSSSDGSIGGGICESLVELNIRMTQVTSSGARHALERLIKLQSLEWSGTVQVIVGMYNDGVRRPLALTKMVFHNFVLRGPVCGATPSLGTNWSPANFEPNSLATAIRLCPFLDHVDFGYRYKPFSLDVRALLQLDNLKFLSIRDAFRINFNEDLLPVLQKFGHKSLEHLYVNHAEDLNLGAIVELCSKLRWLTAYRVMTKFPHQSGRSFQPNPKHLPRLQHLRLSSALYHSDLDFQPSASDLALVLASSPALVSGKFEYLANLSDAVLEQAIIQHGFPKLEELTINFCPNVTQNGVDLFMELDNPLSFVVFDPETGSRSPEY